MKRSKKILIIILIVTAFVGLVFMTYRVLDKQESKNKNQEYELNGYIIKEIDMQDENLSKDSLEENTIESEMLENSGTAVINEKNAEKSTLNGIFSESEDITLEFEDSTIGIIEIPKLGLVAPIKEGTDLEVLAKFVGHFSNSSIWDGNVALAAHNRGTSVKHYFDRINELVNGDIIIYRSKLGERSYEVISSKEIENTDWSVTESDTNEKNTITLITCIKNQPEKRLCVVAKEKN